MKTCLKLTFVLLLLSLYCQAQQASPFKAQNSVYLEFLGSGALYSINYERLFLLKERQAYGFRIGTTFFGKTPVTAALIGELYTLIGTGNHHGDFAIGLSGVSGRDIEVGSRVDSRDREYSLFAVPRLSYRYQKPTGGLMLRAGFTPFITLIGDSRIFSPSLGLSIGHSF